MKKWISVLLAAVMLLPLIAACQLTDEGANDPNATDPAETELDLAAIVATVGGEEITLGEMKTLFDSYVEYFSYYGYDVTSDEATLHSFQDDLVNRMVEDKLVEYKAKQLGYDQLDAEGQAELDSRVEEELGAMEDYYRQQAEDEFASDSSVDVEARIIELILEEAAYNMAKDDATYEEYAEFLKKDIVASYLEELLKAGELKDVAVGEEEIQAKYDELLAADTAAYTEDAAAYKTNQDAYESAGEGLPALYVPEGYHRIYDIFIAFEGTLSTDYAAKEAEMKKLKTEYQDLAFADALAGNTENAARMAEILAQYNALQAECDGLYGEYAASAKAKIDEIYAKLQGGADFKELMLADSENENFKSSELFAERGILLSTVDESEYDWLERTKQVFSTLGAGEYSEPFAEEDGYHIIFYVGDETAGARPLADVYEAIRSQVLEGLMETEWQALLDAWKNDGDVVVINEEVYRPLGKAVG